MKGNEMGDNYLKIPASEPIPLKVPAGEPIPLSVLALDLDGGVTSRHVVCELVIDERGVVI
jgi:hypothetical protein